MPFPWRRDANAAVEISFEFPPPASRDSDEEEEPTPSDIDFYESALKEMRARRTPKEALRRTKSRDSNNGMDNSGTTTLTGDTTDESAASIQSFLSWASNTSNYSQDLDEKQAEQYWRDRARGRVPTRRHTDGSLQSYLGKFAGNSSSPRDLNSSLSLLEVSSVTSANSSASAAKAAEHHDSFRQLQYSKEDLQFLAFGENRDFHKLQKSLRREGAITNELLKQVLPMVVSQSQQRRKIKQRMVEQQQQQSLSKILELETDESARTASTVLAEEKKEELAY